MKKFLIICGLVLCLSGAVTFGLYATNVLVPSHTCGQAIKHGKIYNVKPSATNNSRVYKYQIGDFRYYKSLHKQFPDRYPDYVLKQDSLTMFGKAYELCKNLDITNDKIDYLVTADAHETLAAHILYFLSDVETFSHYHRLVEKDIKYYIDNTIAPDLEIYGKDGSIYSFMFNESLTGIDSMEIYNDEPNPSVTFLLQSYYITQKLALYDVKDSGYVINGCITDASFNEFLLDRNKYLNNSDYSVYNNKTFYSKDINGNITIIDRLPEFHLMFIKGDVAYSNNPHAKVLKQIKFKV